MEAQRKTVKSKAEREGWWRSFWRMRRRSEGQNWGFRHRERNLERESGCPGVREREWAGKPVGVVEFGCGETRRKCARARRPTISRGRGITLMKR